MGHRVAYSLVPVTLFRIPELYLVKDSEILTEKVDTEAAEPDLSEGLLRKDISDLKVFQAKETSVAEPPCARLVIYAVAIADMKSRRKDILTRIVLCPAIEESGAVVSLFRSPVERPESIVS